MAIFAAYFDDSSRDDVFAIAGYVARLETWDDDFTPAWREVLARAPRAISEFKATDCRNQLGEFKDWDKEECDELTKNLVDVIEHHTDRDNFLGIGIAVSLPQAESIHGFQSLSRREQRYKRRLREKDVFEICMKLIYVDILTIGARVADESTDTLDLIFDEPT